MNSDIKANSFKIFQGFRSGAQEAFAALFYEWHKPATYFAFNLVQQMQEAEDIISDCFATLWVRRDDFDSLKAAKAFLYTSVRNACYNAIRHRKVIITSHQRFGEADSLGSHLDLMIEGEMACQLYKAIDTLPLECRKVFNLTYLQGKKNGEVAELLQISVHTVKAQKYRGLSLLRKVLVRFLFVFSFLS